MQLCEARKLLALFPKNVFYGCKDTIIPSNTQIFLYYIFPIGNDLYINNVICDAKLHHLLHSTTLFIRNLFYNFSYHTKLFETQTNTPLKNLEEKSKMRPLCLNISV